MDNPLEALWRPRSQAWAILTVLGLAFVFSLVSVPPGRPFGQVLERFGQIAFLGAWIVLLALGGLHVWVKLMRWTDPLRTAWAGVALLTLTATAVSGGLHWLLPELFPGISTGELATRAAGIAATIGLLGLGAFQSLWSNAQLQARVRRAEHDALQARVNPHFLFNTLNTAISLVRQKPALAERLLEDLSDLFRAALGASRSVPLVQELDLCRRYLDIEQLRLGERLHLNWVQPDALPDITVPALSVQPLVENAVRHGVEPLALGGRVDVVVRVESARVRIRIANPLAPPSHRSVGHHIGLSGVRSRLETAMGGSASLVTSTEDGNYVAHLEFPASSSRS